VVPIKPRKTERKAAAVLAAIILSVGLLPCRSLGWGKTWMGTNLEQIVKAARWKIGPFRSNAVFRLGNTGYDSDIFFGQRLIPVPDTTFTAGPELSVYLPLEKGIIFDISEIPQYVFFLQSKTERAWNNAFRGQVHLAFDRLYFLAGGGLINAKERLSTELNLNIRRMENDLGGLAFWQISEGSAVSLQYRATTYEYENPTDVGIDIRGSLNRKERYINLTAYLMQVSRARIFLDAQYGSFTSDEIHSSIEDSRSYGIAGGIEFEPPPLDGKIIRGLQGRINLGYNRFEILGSHQKVFEGLIGNTSVGLNFFKFTTLHGEFARNIRFSAFSSLGYYIQTVLGAGLSQALSRKINFTYGISINRNDYVQLEDSVSHGLEPEKYINHLLGLDFVLGKNLRFNLIANYGERNSNLAEHVNRRFFVGFNLIFGSLSGPPTFASSNFR
jgi:hypothetical protein